jgi:hypothetical protein
MIRVYVAMAKRYFEFLVQWFEKKSDRKLVLFYIISVAVISYVIFYK